MNPRIESCLARIKMVEGIGHIEEIRDLMHDIRVGRLPNVNRYDQIAAADFEIAADDLASRFYTLLVKVRAFLEMIGETERNPLAAKVEHLDQKVTTLLEVVAAYDCIVRDEDEVGQHRERVERYQKTGR